LAVATNSDVLSAVAVAAAMILLCSSISSVAEATSLA
jgi:hypothetical protein